MPGEKPKQPNSKSLTLRKEELECLRLEAECRKFDAETESLRKKRWKFLQLGLAGSPAIVSVVTLCFLWGSGWFENRKQLLELETKRLSEQRGEVSNALVRITEENRRASAFSTVLSNRNVDLQRELARRDALLEELSRQTTNEIARIQSTNRETVLLFYNYYKRAEAERDAERATNRMRVAQFNTLVDAVRRGAVTLTTDSAVRIDELGDIRINDYYFTDGAGRILTDGGGKPIVQGPQIVVPLMGSSTNASNTQDK